MKNEPPATQALGILLKEKTPEELKNFAEQTAKLMTYYKGAIRELETKFHVLNDHLSLSRERNPIESIKTRLKSMKSIQGKLQRLGKPFTPESIEENLNDVAGIRVICGYIDDVYMLAECLLKQDDVVLIKKKDYIKDPKPNGYRSLHLIVEIPIFLSDEKRSVRAEVQLRTIAMETWANLEHGIRYKKMLSEKQLSEVEGKLNECAELSFYLDYLMLETRNIVEKECEGSEDL